ncbi:hypothetical protein H6G36_07990 [Anabaena minutissima FACHB-250]|nr:hypothetical protein [Anabaena minutissima FACHB-250]
MTDTSSDSIWIVTDEAPQIAVTDGVKGISGNTRSWREETTTETTKSVGNAVKVSTQKLEQEMTHFLEVVGRLFNRAEQQANGGMQLDEIELSVEISAEGEVKLIGNGAKAGGKGAIKLVFRRQEPK